MTRIQLVNPNTSAATTDLMLAIARAAAPQWLSITGVTARHGASLITDPQQLALAAAAVVALEGELTSAGVVVAAFGDPGADVLRRRLSVPVIGIGEAAIRAAHAGGRRFSIVTTTPLLEPAIRERVEALGCGRGFASLRISTDDPVRLTLAAEALEEQLQALVNLCITRDSAESVIIGGGPLARAANAIAQRTSVAIIEPVPAAVAWIAKAIGAR